MGEYFWIFLHKPLTIRTRARMMLYVIFSTPSQAHAWARLTKEKSWAPNPTHTTLILKPAYKSWKPSTFASRAYCATWRRIAAKKKRNKILKKTGLWQQGPAFFDKCNNKFLAKSKKIVAHSLGKIHLLWYNKLLYIWFLILSFQPQNSHLTSKDRYFIPICDSFLLFFYRKISIFSQLIPI